MKPVDLEKLRALYAAVDPAAAYAVDTEPSIMGDIARRYEVYQRSRYVITDSGDKYTSWPVIGEHASKADAEFHAAIRSEFQNLIKHIEAMEAVVNAARKLRNFGYRCGLGHAPEDCVECNADHADESDCYSDLYDAVDAFDGVEPGRIAKQTE